MTATLQTLLDEIARLDPLYDAACDNDSPMIASLEERRTHALLTLDGAMPRCNADAAPKLRHVARCGAVIAEELDDDGCAGDFTGELIAGLVPMAVRIETGDRQTADLIEMRRIANAAEAAGAFFVSRWLRIVADFLSRPRVV
jgi:hypothetical protein